MSGSADVTQVPGRHLIDLPVVGDELEVMHEEGQCLPVDGSHEVTDVDESLNDLLSSLLSFRFRDVVECFCCIDEGSIER